MAAPLTKVRILVFISAGTARDGELLFKESVD
jgi:hypothetical protein